MADRLQAALASASQYFERELSTLRTGRANPAMIEDLVVECYGARSPLQQVASISAPEPRLLLVQPWDATIIKDIEKALNASSLGISPVVDGKNIRLPIPAMTEERRTALLKVVQEKAEQARVRIRSAREEALKDLRQQQRDKTISEDQLSAASKEVQAAVDQAIAQIAAEVERKTKEIMTV